MRRNYYSRGCFNNGAPHGRDRSAEKSLRSLPDIVDQDAELAPRVSLEVAEGSEIAVYQEIRQRIMPPIGIQPEARQTLIDPS